MTPAYRRAALCLVFSLVVLMLFTGCGATSPPDPPAPAPGPLSAANVNLIFVVSEDIANEAAGDMNRQTGNLSSQGLQRALSMATFLKQNVLGSANVTDIYALEPMTHLQTANQYPDMVGLETVQQFALLNVATMSSDLQGGTPYTAQSYPLNASYANGPLPEEVPSPSPFCPNCQGLDFNDTNGDNDALLSRIVQKNVAGFYVFATPWETTSAMLANLNSVGGYGLALPSSYQGPNYVYAISIAPSGKATLTSYYADLHPGSTYPTLPPPKLVTTACTAQTPFSITLTGGVDGAVVPAGTNTNETVYIIRHAEAHPQGYWDDNNYVGAGQWRALELPNALQGKASPNVVYSIDPGQYGPGSVDAAGVATWSTVAPALTAEPYAIANNLPYNLFSTFLITDSAAPQTTSGLLFTGGSLSGQKVLLAWAYQYIQPTINVLLASYHGKISSAPAWPDTDYDSIWTVTLDGHGNLTIDNAQCEGIDSSALPAMPPQF